MQADPNASASVFSEIGRFHREAPADFLPAHLADGYRKELRASGALWAAFLFGSATLRACLQARRLTCGSQDSERRKLPSEVVLLASSALVGPFTRLLKLWRPSAHNNPSIGDRLDQSMSLA